MSNDEKENHKSWDAHPAFSKDRGVYHRWFLEEFSKPDKKSRLVSIFGKKYYTAVMELYKERLEKNDFSIGPQNDEDWKSFRVKYPKE